MSKTSNQPAKSARGKRRPVTSPDGVTTQVDERRRVVMPRGLRPNTRVTIEEIGDAAWLVRRVRATEQFKLVLIPSVASLPDDPNWEAIEEKFARYCTSKLPSPDFD